MDDTFFRTEIMMDSLCRAMGDYALRKRQLVADYKDSSGRDFHQDLTTWHNRNATDESLVQSVQKELAGRGYTLTALGEHLESGKGRALYLAPGYMEEIVRELGLTMPKDLIATLDAAGGRPVNWMELVHGS